MAFRRYQLRALLRKNLLLMKRRLRDVIRELAMPIFLLGVLIMLKSVVPNYSFDATLDYPSAPVGLSEGGFYTGQALSMFNATPIVGIAPCTDPIVLQLQEELQISPKSSQFCGKAFLGEEMCFGITYRCFNSTDQLISEAVNQQSLFAGLSFGVPLKMNSSMSFQIHMNDSVVSYPASGDFAKDAGPSNVPNSAFTESGFMGLQNAVQSAILQLKGITAPKISFKQFPNNGYLINSGIAVMQSILPLYLTILFSIQIRTSLTAVLEEKENKLREGMLMVGLSPLTNNLGWFITFGLKNGVLVLVLTFACKFSLMPATDFFVLLIYFTLFAVMSQAYTFFIASFFTSAKLGSLIGYLIYFVASLPVYVLTSSNVSGGVQYAFSLLGPLGFAFGLSSMLNAESVAAEGIKFSNLMEPPLGSNVSVGGIMLMLLLDIVLYSVLTWYLDQVMVSSFGSKKPCCFCFQKRAVREGVNQPLISDAQSDSHVIGADIELVSGNLHPSVRVRNLRKGFHSPTMGEVNAVDNLSIDMYDGEITALLGHNGAGKTTAINLLTGMLTPSGGDAMMFGKSINDNMDSIRKMIGVCPQHNILWPLLTVQEHLELFAGLKGMNPEAGTREAVRWLTEVGLSDKADALSSTLSGGMKRKLSVAMALLGDPRIVFLDEPTAGMDPQARRTMWDLLSRQKQNRVIVLTTHYMDEADLLGDRIAIMSKGRLRVMGSSLFLKAKFGLGYHLVLELPGESADMRAAAEQLIMRHIDEARKEEDTANKAEMRYLLPRASVPQFANLFDKLETEKKTVTSYGLSETTLEEVFVRLADENTQNDVGASTFSDTKTFDVGALPVKGNGGESHTIQTKGLLNVTRNAPSGKQTCGSQLLPLIKKRFAISKRDKKSLWFQCGLPILLMGVSAAFGSLKNISSPVASRVVISASVLDSADILSRLPLSVRVSHPIGSHYPSWLGELPLPYSGKQGLVVSQPELDGASNIINFSLSLLGSCKNCESAIWGDDNNMMGLYNASYLISPTLLLNWMGTAMYRQGVNDSTVSIATEYIPFPRAAGQPTQDLGSVIYAGTSALYASSGFMTIGAIAAVFVVKERISGAKHQQLLAGVTPIAYWAGTLIFDCLFFLVPVIGVLIMIQILGLDGLASPGENFVSIFVVFLFFGPATLAAAYLVSNFFTSPTTAQTVVLLGQSFVLILLTGANIALQIALPEYPAVAKAVSYLGNLVPNSCLNAAMSQLAQAGSTCALLKQSGQTCPSYNPLGLDYAGGPILFLLGDFLLFFGGTMFLEYRGRHAKKGGTYGVPPRVEDEDVVAERKRLESDRSDNVCMMGLHKRWPPRGKQPEKIAVEDFTLGIKKGTVFGLLGVNGAGKTTLLSMLTGVTPPTGGEATVAGYSILTQLEEVQKLLGFCPQFDALFDDLTAREHLTLYASLKAIPKDQIEGLVSALLELLTLTEHANKLSKELSGGNKRKLSLAIALLGTPRVMMLDEPSAGMDPMARRSILEVVSFSITDSDTSVILTTHLMEECEALANRIGIMVNGGLACLGSLQHLKARFGAFWQMELQVADEKYAEGARQLVLTLCPGAELLEWHQGHFLYKLPSEGTPLAKVYREIEAAKQQLHIVDYSVSQCSLEQIFLAFAKHQIETQD